MANMLVETLAGDFDADEFEDDYADAVQTLVKAKIEGGEVKKTPTATKSSGEVVDLLAALQRSVDAAKTARGESTSSDDDEKKPAKKTAARKTASKRRAVRASRVYGVSRWLVLCAVPWASRECVAPIVSARWP